MTARTDLEGAARELAARWKTDARWSGVERPYSAEDVIKLRGTIREEHTLARLGAERLDRKSVV